jgi:hypothetical protein
MDLRCHLFVMCFSFVCHVAVICLSVILLSFWVRENAKITLNNDSQKHDTNDNKMAEQ